MNSIKFNFKIQNSKIQILLRFEKKKRREKGRKREKKATWTFLRSRLPSGASRGSMPE